MAPARSVSLLVSGRPGSSLLPPRLPPCSVGSGSSGVLRLRLLLHGWLGWGPLSRSLGSCRWSGRPCTCCPCALRAVRGFCLVGCSLSACFYLALQVSSPSFHSPLPRSLSLSALSCSSPLASGGCSLLAPVSVFDAIIARVVPRHFSCGIPVGIPQFL